MLICPMLTLEFLPALWPWSSQLLCQNSGGYLLVSYKWLSQEVVVLSLACCSKHGHRLFFFSFVDLAMLKDITVQKRKAHYWVLHLLIHRPHSCRGGFSLDLCLCQLCQVAGACSAPSHRDLLWSHSFFF